MGWSPDSPNLSGHQFLKFGELSNGDASSPAQISQTVAITPGHRYQLSFALAGKLGDPAIKGLTATIGTATTPFAFDTTTHATQNQGWVQETVATTECNATTLPIVFTQTTPGARGAQIDDVTLTDQGPDEACSTPPAITRVTPSSGPASGNTEITDDDALGQVAQILFGTVPADDFVCTDNTTCSVISPPGAGTVDMTAVGPAGTSTTSAADRFTYLAGPTVSGLTPRSRSRAWRHHGHDQRPQPRWRHRRQVRQQAGGPVHVHQRNSCSASAPAGTGTVDVTVTTPTGTSQTSAADRFTYLAGPTVSGLTPRSGPERGGTTVAISGHNLDGATDVKFGAKPAARFTCTSDSCSASAPAGTGTVDVTVTTPTGTSQTSAADRFTYLAAPTVSGRAQGRVPRAAAPRSRSAATTSAARPTSSSAARLRPGSRAPATRARRALRPAPERLT